MKTQSRAFPFFRSLRGRLTLTYLGITAFLPLLFIFFAVFLAGFFIVQTNNDQEYILDVVSEFRPRGGEFVLDEFGLQTYVSQYWEGGEPNAAELQSWLDWEVADGYASPPPQGLLDSAAAAINRSYPVTIIAPDQTILAQSPAQNVGEKLPADLVEPSALSALLEADSFYVNNLAAQDGGGYFISIPLVSDQPAFESLEPKEPLAHILLWIHESPPLAMNRLVYLTTIAAIASTVFLLVILPLGALFGYIAARGLTRRIDDLAWTADQYSTGNFAARPRLQRRDELGNLGLRLTTMAEQIQALLQSNQQLAIVEERNRLARDLHDTVKQQNFATLMQVRAAKLRLDEPIKAEGFLESAETLLKQSQDELHNLIGELRPAALQNTGLATALEQLGRDWSSHARIACDVRVRGERPLPLTIEQTLFRVAQEGLANVARHSSAENVTLTLDYTPKSVTLTLQDDGVGFDASKQRGGFGLSTMRQRLEEQDGQLIVDSQIGVGTTIVAEIKLTRSDLH